mmetsp:Transcript_30782/g.95222  ORF Transcript_30782/g.95222 Transcript_30782/m.95222 type:complete len:98 (-) Transcript_30782:4446-4739(-)
MLCNVPTEMLVRAPRCIAHATPCVGSGLGVGLMMLLSVGPRRVIRNPTFSNQCNAIATGREEEAELLRLDALQAITVFELCTHDDHMHICASVCFSG